MDQIIAIVWQVTGKSKMHMHDDATCSKIEDNILLLQLWFGDDNASEVDCLSNGPKQRLCWSTMLLLVHPRLVHSVSLHHPGEPIKVFDHPESGAKSAS